MRPPQFPNPNFRPGPQNMGPPMGMPPNMGPPNMGMPPMGMPVCFIFCTIIEIIE